MTSGTWPVQSYHQDYLPMGSLGCLTPSPCIASPIGSSMAAGGQTYNNFSAIGSISCPNIITAPGGLPIGFPIFPYPVDAGRQTSLGTSSSPWYPAPGDFQNATIYHGNYSGNQMPILHSWVPSVPIPVQQLATKYPIDAGYRTPYSFPFGHTLQLSRTVMDWSDSHAVSMEIDKLKQAWREGVGMKRRHRKNQKQTYHESGTGRWAADQDCDRPVWTGGSLDFKVQATPAGPAREYEYNFNKTNTANSPATSCMSSDSINELITELKQLEKNELLLSPEVTPTRMNPRTNNNSDKSPPKPTKEGLQPLRFGSELKVAKTRTSVLPAPKETPTMKTETSSTRLSKVASLRPPKAIARSSKPVTQPVPFNLVGDAMSRKLKLKREQQHQNVSVKA